MPTAFDDFAFKPFRPTEIFFYMARHAGVRHLSSEGAGNKSHQQAGGVRRKVWASLHAQ
jgi:hypothetical protein